MPLQQELGFPKPIEEPSHEAVLNILVTADMLAKEGERVVRPAGLTESQFNVLMLLMYQSDGGEMDQTTLGRMLVVNRSNVTGLVDRMEKAGLVVRVPDPRDRRVKRVSTTPAGRRALKDAEALYMERVREVMGALSVKERAVLSGYLERLRAKLALALP
jgi:DNA-binding MarR family transcriptional regulator